MNEIKQKLMRKILEDGISEEMLHAAYSVFFQSGTPMETSRNSRFFSTEEACEFCGGIAKSTLWHWSKKGLKSHCVGGRRLFLESELREFIVSSNSSKAS